MTYPPAMRPPDATKNALAVARALTIGLRAWRFYPEEHPALGMAMDRLSSVTAEVTGQGPLMLAVTPETLMVDGAPLDADSIVSECARLLHDVDLIQVSFVAAAPRDAVRRLLATLNLERKERRTRGGPAAIWEADGHPSIVLEQIDYQELLEREEDEGPARRDVLWQSIVRSIIAGRRTFTEAEQQRLLEISKDAWVIGELADDCRTAYCGPDGSPLLTTQAATVMAVYRHIAATVGVLEPERGKDVVGNFALTTSALEPALAMEVLRMQESPDEAQPIMSALKQTFDEQQVAMLLARALAKSGEVTNRLSQMLDTMAPDEERRQRVLRLADKLLTERDFGAKRPITDIRNSLEELLLKYDESPYVSETYRDSMDRATDRAAEMAARDLPPERDEWVATLGHEAVREISGQLLIDLLNLETIEARAGEIARDMSAFAQDLMMSGAYVEAKRIVEALRSAATTNKTVAADACLSAIANIGQATGMSEAVHVLGELNATDASAIAQLCVAIGPTAVPALLTGFAKEEGGTQAQRAAKILISLGATAIPEMSSRLDDRKWWVQREVAQVLGTIGTPAAVPPLQNLLRRGDARVLKAVVPALSGIDDPSATRALGMVLRSVSGTARTSVVESLVAVRDARVVPMLARIIDESEPLGRDFDMVLETLDAVASFTDDRAVRSVGNVARQRKWYAPGRSRRMRERALATLVKIGTPGALSAVETMEKTGDRQLRKLARAAKPHTGNAV
jgi:HEAT repeat protein